MDLLIAGIVLFLLFVATYSQRRTWITLGSTALTIVLIAGIALLTTAEKSNPMRESLDRLAAALPSGWDRRALDLANAFEQASLASAAARQRAAERVLEPIFATSMWSISDWLDWGSWSSGTRSDTVVESEPAATPEPQPVRAEEVPAPIAEPSNTPIKWLLDGPRSGANEGFAVSGTNLSDQPLTVLRAVLKPDNGAAKLPLTLVLDEGGTAEDAVIPPGAGFSLKTVELASGEAQYAGGAILSVAYELAGRRKTSILYLTEDRFAAGATSN